MYPSCFFQHLFVCTSFGGDPVPCTDFGSLSTSLTIAQWERGISGDTLAFLIQFTSCF